MTRDQVKEIAVALGQPPRKAREAMIVAILEVQGEPQIAPDDSVKVVETGEALETVEGVLVEAVPSLDFERLESVQVAWLQALESVGNVFLTQMTSILDDKITDLGKTIEGIAFNLTPEQPMAVEEPAQTPAPRRRLLRS
jgi:hypothetical protein